MLALYSPNASVAATEEQPVQDAFNDYWRLTITGTIQEIEKTNIDKSGNNPRHNVHLMISADDVRRPEGEVTLPEVFKVRTDDAGLAALGSVAAGDRVKVEYYESVALFIGKKGQKPKAKAGLVLHSSSCSGLFN